jgi:hypothetical protein
MTQALAQVLHFKGRQQYEEALREVGRALREFGEGGEPPDHRRSLEDWLQLCRKHPGSAGGIMLAVAAVLKEQGDLFAIQDKAVDALLARQLATGILIEALLKEECFVSGELVETVEELIRQSAAGPQPPALLRRLVSYLEVRGDFAGAEDRLFDWLETGEPDAVEAGRIFYERLASLPEDSLQAGRFSRAEAEEGAREWEKAARQAVSDNP